MKNLILLFAAILLTLRHFLSLFSGSQSNQTANICYHTYDLLDNNKAERLGYGMYTYVLFGHNPKIEADSQVLKRYKGLLDAIYVSTKTELDYGLSLCKVNCFYIPINSYESPCKRYPELNEYNFGLSKTILEKCGEALLESQPDIEKKLNNPGPFLISLRYPLNILSAIRCKENIQLDTLMFADLTDSHPLAFNEIVKVYKSELKGAKENAIEKFGPLRLKLLDILLKGNEAVKLVLVNLPQWDSVFSKI